MSYIINDNHVEAIFRGWIKTRNKDIAIPRAILQEMSTQHVSDFNEIKIRTYTRDNVDVMYRVEWACVNAAEAEKDNQRHVRKTVFFDVNKLKLCSTEEALERLVE